MKRLYVVTFPCLLLVMGVSSRTTHAAELAGEWTCTYSEPGYVTQRGLKFIGGKHC
jgi:hypothetical protein